MRFMPTWRKVQKNDKKIVLQEKPKKKKKTKKPKKQNRAKKNQVRPKKIHAPTGPFLYQTVQKLSK